ncbi:hypothetical protein [uncultured Polaribacter sp.]|uniref:hypothetical protein n=1 Tax=uncultured Polaribacter sp. TaxID=174711 RepID=UPI00260636B6|nr:hypothetical protein [uncultured Polaribacter sp.]
MKYCIALLALFFWINVGYSQSNSEYLFSSEIEALYKKDTTAKNYQHYAINFTNIGDYKNTLRLEEEFILNYKGLNHKQGVLHPNFKNYKPVSAIKEIIKEAGKHQIVIINEAHYSAQNRVFSQLVLEKLKAKGFKTLFVETIKPPNNKKFDALLNTRKYPLLTTGYYLRDPQYGNMIRKALQLNYKVLPYESIPNDSIKDPMKRWSAREKGQAKNILNYLEKHPKSKIVIHCGYGHLAEKMHEGNLGMMGAVLKQQSGLNPFTIKQTTWLETFSEKTKNPYRKLIDKNPPTDISVFKNTVGDYFSPDKENYDIQVYFPKTKYINGRPDWLLMIKNRKIVNIPYSKIQLDFPYLVFAYHANEGFENTVAADIVEIKNKDDKKSLVLENGNYQLIIKNQQGKVQILSINVE